MMSRASIPWFSGACKAGAVKAPAFFCACALPFNLDERTSILDRGYAAPGCRLPS